MTTRQIFRGRTLMEARRAAEQSLGGGAVLLTTREVRRPGLAGILGTREFEVVAAPPEAPPPPPAPRLAQGLFARGVYADTPEPHDPPPSPSVQTLRTELRAELRAIKGAMARPERVAPEILTELAALRAAIEEATPELLMGDTMASLLRAQGIDGPAATALARALKHTDDGTSSSERLRVALAEVVKVAPWPIAGEGRAVIALVGPTGVGKTTTIAKLAAHARMARRTVTLVSCDGFRVGAIDQLRRYASLLGADFATASTRDELARCIDAATTDLVFVDTAGRAPKPDGVESILASAAFARRDFTRHLLLCVPAALRAQDADATVRTFAHLDPTALAVTKIDETSAPAGLVHAPVASKLPVSVLCAGQGVPEHIAQATAAAVYDHIASKLAARGAVA
jgi:flagellar biosynthesis protein FlhF